ncbi:hypothetical protein BX600DRAFT_517991 [Xylariales sp. PMI_506]|nr:hypothetical protein BX600DRAFT_517991 [Xylariales sp. PMI_506]
MEAIAVQPHIIAPGVIDAPNSISRANEFLDHERFHQSVTFPAGTLTGFPGEFTVTYCDYGAPAPAPGQPAPKTVLICGPLLGSRWIHVTKHKLAQERGLRIIHPDRPGFGGTTEVDQQLRIKAWLAIVPALLNHLGIEHVSLVAQSGGAIYAANTLLHLRHILDPARPYAAFCAPWVHPSRTGATAMQLVNLLPNAVVSYLDRAASLFNGAFDAVSGPGTALGASSSLIGAGFSAITGGGSAAASLTEDDEFELLARPLWVKRAYAQNVRGLSEDALLLLRKGGQPDEWGSWSDWDDLVPLLAAAETDQRSGGNGADLPKLRVDVFFAESDVMIGTKVQGWFDSCWAPEKRGEGIDYESHEVEGADHDNILNLQFGVAQKIFLAISS